MRTSKLILLSLVLIAFCCSNQIKIKDILNKIHKENSSLESVQINKKLVYKFSDNIAYNYTIVKKKSAIVLVNNDTGSFIVNDSSGVLYFYHNSQDTLFFTDNSTGYAWTVWEDLIHEHEFVLNPSKYWNTNHAKKFKRSTNASNDNLFEITFEMNSFNVDILIDKMFVKSVGSYFIKDSSFHIQSFVKKIDPELIAGDGIYKEKYHLSHNSDNKDISHLIALTDSLIKTKGKSEFPKNYDLAGNLFKTAKKTPEKKKSSTPLVQNPLQLQAIDGDTLTLSNLKSEYILLDFWFMRCPGCIKGIPHINKLNEKYSVDKLVVLGVNPVDNHIKGLKDFSQKKNITYPLYLADKRFTEYFDIEAYPTYVLIDNRNDSISILGRYSILDELNNALKELK